MVGYKRGEKAYEDYCCSKYKVHQANSPIWTRGAKTVKRALEIDAENGNQLWQDAIAKDMEEVRVSFKTIQ